jgi:hypothetical protein
MSDEFDEFGKSHPGQQCHDSTSGLLDWPGSYGVIQQVNQRNISD